MDEEDCSYVWNVPSAERCDWVESTEDCKTDGFIPYTTLLFCTFGTQSSIAFGVGILLFSSWLLYLFLVISAIADNFLCPCLSAIASMLRLSGHVAGATILAFGNGSADIFTSLVATEQERLTVFTGLIGAGVFATCVVAGCVIAFVPCALEPKYFLRHAVFLLAAICWISFITWDEVVDVWEALGCILIYILFIAVVILMQCIEDKGDLPKRRIPALWDPDTFRASPNRLDDVTWVLPRRSRAYELTAKLDVAIEREFKRKQWIKGMRSTPDAKPASAYGRPRNLFLEFFYDASPLNVQEWRSGSALTRILTLLRMPIMLVLQLLLPVVNETAIKRGWSQLLNCLQIAFTPVVILFIVGVANAELGPLPLWAVCLSCTGTIALMVFVLTSVDTIPKFHNALAFLGFLSGMVLIYAVAQQVMAVLRCIGFASGISNAMLGITLLAWGNSLADLVSNVGIARKGFPHTGFSASFGGATFNILVGLGLSYGTAILRSDELRIKIRTSQMGPGCLIFLLASLCTSILYFSTTCFNARRPYGYLLFTIYGVFLLINILGELDLILSLGVDYRPNS